MRHVIRLPPRRAPENQKVTWSDGASYAKVARYTTSWNSGMAPAVSTGVGSVFHVTPSGLVARKTAFVAQVPGAFTGNTAQNSLRSGIHCASMCQANCPGGTGRFTGVGSDQVMPFIECRSSTVVEVPWHPGAPLTD